MKNKKLLVVLIIVLLFLGFICQKTYNVIQDMNEKESSYYDNPTTFYYLPQEEQDLLLEEMSVATSEEICESLEKLITDYVNSNEKLTLNSINAYQDNLIMHEKWNQKIYKNCFVDVEVTLDNEGMTYEEREDYVSEIYDDFDKVMSLDVYGTFKLNECNMSIKDGIRTLGFNYGITNNGEQPLLNQPEEELITQTLVYDFVNSYRYYKLSKFGIIDGDLYIEIPINDVYRETDREKILKEIPEICEILYNKIIASPDAKKYIEDNDCKTITMSFYCPWKKEVITHNYAIG